MLWNLTDPDYARVRAIRRGDVSLDPRVAALVAWIGDALDVHLIDFGCEARETSAGYRQQFVWLFVDRIAEAEAAPRHPNAERVRRRLFVELTSGGLPRELLERDVHPFNPDGSYPELGLAFRPLEELEITRAHLAARPRLESIIDRHRRAGHVTSMSTDSFQQRHVIWVDSDEHLATLHAKGVCGAIEDELLKALAEHDEFGWVGAPWLRTEWETEERYPSVLDYYR